MAPVLAPESLLIPLADIEIPPNFRKSKPSKVNELADSIAFNGLLQPIGVRKGIGGKPFVLVFGGHRLAAHKKLKLGQIEARLLEMSSAQAESAMIAENLFRNPLKSAEYLIATKRWEELFKAEHGEAKRGPKSGDPEVLPTVGTTPEPTDEATFQRVAAETLGVSKTKIYEDAKAARILSDENLEVMRDREVGLLDIRAVAAIKTEDDREKAVLLIASGMEPKTAIALATAPDNATLTTVEQDDEPSYKPEHEYDDEEWVLTFCSETIKKLSFTTAFKSDAILWRKTRDALNFFRKTANALMKTKSAFARSPLRYRYNSLLAISHPNTWYACGNCGGTGSGCNTCNGFGYSIRNEGSAR
jgi:hypothetical protein